MDSYINTLTLENISDWPLIIKIIFVFIVFLLIFFSGYQLDVRSQFNQLTLLQDKVKKLQLNFNKKQQSLLNLGSSKYHTQELIDIKKQLEKFSAKFRFDLLKTITDVGNVNGVDVVLLKPFPEKITDFYGEIPFEITVIGQYQKLKKFIMDLSSLKQIITLSDFTLSYHVQERLMLHCTVKFYYYLNASAKKKNSEKKLAKIILPEKNKNPFQRQFFETKEPLEAYDLSDLKMIGTISQDGNIWALVVAPDGIVYTLSKGNYLGKMHGKIINITTREIILQESNEFGVIKNNYISMK